MYKKNYPSFFVFSFCIFLGLGKPLSIQANPNPISWMSMLSSALKGVHPVLANPLDLAVLLAIPYLLISEDNQATQEEDDNENSLIDSVLNSEEKLEEENSEYNSSLLENAWGDNPLDNWVNTDGAYQAALFMIFMESEGLF